MASRRDVSSRLGSAIRTIREERGLGLRQVAKAVGVSFPYISQIERGLIDTPGADVLKKIAKALGCSAPQLFALSASVSPDVLKAAQKHPDEFVLLAKSFGRLNRRDAELVSANFDALLDYARKMGKTTG